MLMDDEATSMLSHAAEQASARGILQCLRLLAEEAAALNLHRTLWAIQDAVETVTDESRVGRVFATEPRIH
jgi:hypothetical protein